MGHLSIPSWPHRHRPDQTTTSHPVLRIQFVEKTPALRSMIMIRSVAFATLGISMVSGAKLEKKEEASLPPAHIGETWGFLTDLLITLPERPSNTRAPNLKSVLDGSYQHRWTSRRARGRNPDMKHELHMFMILRDIVEDNKAEIYDLNFFDELVDARTAIARLHERGIVPPPGYEDLGGEQPYFSALPTIELWNEALTITKNIVETPTPVATQVDTPGLLQRWKGKFVSTFSRLVRTVADTPDVGSAFIDADRRADKHIPSFFQWKPFQPHRRRNGNRRRNGRQ